ncbi:MAG: hypothetical protein QM820_33140 [Minicystis sp.]
MSVRSENRIFAALLPRELRPLDGEDVRQRAPIDLVPCVVVLGLEHEQRRVRAEHPERRREPHDLGLGRAIAALLRRLGHELGDARPDPRPLQERAIDLHELRLHRPAVADAHARVGAARDLRVDERLVAGLHAVEPLGPLPARALDLHRDRSRRRREPSHRRLGPARSVDHHAVAGEPRSRHPAQQRIIPDPADGDRIDALHPRAAQRLRRLAQRGRLGRALRRHAVGDEHDPRRLHLARPGPGPRDRAAEIRRAQRLPLAQPHGPALRPRGRGAFVDHVDALIERRHDQRRGRLDPRDHPIDQLDLRLEPERPRRARVHHDDGRPQRIGPRLRRRLHAEEHQLAGPQPVAPRQLRGIDHEVAIGRSVLQVDLPEDGRIVAGARDDGVELRHLRQAAQHDGVRRLGADLLRVRDDQLLPPAGRDREHARRELVARGLLEQRRILPPVEEVLVGLPRGLLLDDLALLPAIALAHREPADGRALRQRDAERPFERAALGVVEREPHLGERERPLDHAPRLVRREREPGAVRGRERERRGGRALDLRGWLGRKPVEPAGLGDARDLLAAGVDGRAPGRAHRDDGDHRRDRGDGNEGMNFPHLAS